jgi:hypothetical protein
LAERRLVVLAACIGLAFAVYWPSLAGGFYNDDAMFLNMADRVLEQPSRLFAERPLGYFRPAWLLYVAAQKLVFGLSPLGYRVVGVALHGVVGFLVWLLVRRALRDTVAAWCATFVFLCLYAHSEAVLWIAAHNSTLAAGLCVGALLLHLRAVESARLGAALLTALAVLAALWTKEPSAVLLAWLPLGEMLLVGWRSPFTRRGLLRGALIAAAVAVFIVSNPSVGAAFRAQSELANAEVRATFAFVEVGRVLESSAQMLSPLAENASHPGPGAAGALLAALLLLAPLALVGVLRRRDLMAPAALGLLLMLTAMVPASMTRLQQPNGSRLYYFPTVGVALLVGVLASLVRGVQVASPSPAPATADTRATALILPAPLRWVPALGLLLFLGWHVRAIRASDAADYRPLSISQTATAVALGPVLADAEGHAVILLEPWLDNLMHLQEFLTLYHGVERARVQRFVQPRAEAGPWLQRQRQLDPGVRVLDWDEPRGFVPATGLPPNRAAGPGVPHAPDALPRLPHVTAFRIAPAPAPAPAPVPAPPGQR